MKKTVSLLLFFLITISCMLPVSAEFLNPPIVDGAGYLTDAQLAELSADLQRVRDTYNFDLAIYIEAEMSGADSEASADDIYDYFGYGTGENYDGMMLYIAADTRNYHFTTTGYGITAFTDNGLIYLEKSILPFLKGDNYYEAFKTYISRSEELLKMAESGHPYNEKQLTTSYLIFVIGGALLLPLLIAFIMMNSKLSKMNTAVAQAYAANYIKDNSMKMNVSRDIFLYSNITKTEKPKSSDSNVHTSSSGKTHGGRGGSF